MKVSEELQKLIGELNKAPMNSAVRSVGDFTEQLSVLIPLAQRFEAISGDPDLSEKYEALKEEFRVLKTNHATQVGDLKNQVEALMKEKIEREKKDPELPPDQLRILQALPPPSGRGWTAYQITDRLNIRADLVDSHISKLSKSKHIDPGINGHRQRVWCRSNSGNDYVIAWSR